MEYQDFINNIRTAVASKMGPEYEVFTRKVLKYNSVRLESLMIRKGDDQIMPSIYLESFYNEEEEGRTIDELSDNIIELYKRCIANVDVNVCLDFSREAVRENIVFRLINYEKNKELLEDSIYIKVNDLAAVYFYLASENGDTLSSIRLTRKNLRTFGLEEDELYDLAMRNTERIFRSTMRPIREVMKELYERQLMNKSEDDELSEEIKSLLESGANIGMFVLTNTKGLNGATCLIYDGLLDRIHDIFEKDFYILPCSVHEVLLIPVKGEDESERLEEMVKTVNRTNVSEQDFLSDSVYRYSKDSFKI